MYALLQSQSEAVVACALKFFLQDKTRLDLVIIECTNGNRPELDFNLHPKRRARIACKCRTIDANFRPALIIFCDEWIKLR
jgi:hypothetical protein